MFYFVRHGKTDYSQRNTKVYQGFGVNLARLSEKGVEQIRETARDPRLPGDETDPQLPIHPRGTDGSHPVQSTGSGDCH